jgi:hypothetical protein
MTNLALYQIADQYLIDLDKINDMELDDQTFKDTLEALTGDFELKATNVSMYVRNIEASVDAIKQAEKQMYERRKSLENKIDRLKEYLKDNMIRTGITKIDCPYFQLSLRNNPESVEVINLDMIPPEYFDIPPLPAPILNKKAVKDAIKNGIEVDGAKLIRNQSLQIK